MLDDLRSEADFAEDEEENDHGHQESVVAVPAQSQFLGMTPVQRFVVAAMILVMICILGSFFLLITETVWLPF